MAKIHLFLTYDGKGKWSVSRNGECIGTFPSKDDALKSPYGKWIVNKDYV